MAGSMPRSVDHAAHRGRLAALQCQALDQSTGAVYRETETPDYQCQPKRGIGYQIATGAGSDETSVRLVRDVERTGCVQGYLLRRVAEVGNRCVLPGGSNYRAVAGQTDDLAFSSDVD